MSANRVMRNISRFIEEKLGLKVNMIKSKVDKPQGLKYLGFGFYFDSKAHQYKAKPHAKSVAKFKKRMKELTCRSWGVRFKNPLSAPHVHLETMENSTEPRKEPCKTWNKQKHRKTSCIYREKNSLCLQQRCCKCGY